MMELGKYIKNIQNICKALSVKRLGTFGSVNADNFNENSDIDMFVMFDNKSEGDLFTRYFELKERLEDLFGREVEIITEESIHNPYFKKSMEKTKKVIYEV